MAQEYQITKVSEQDPRQWTGEHGTVYYIKVMLDGHNKPVEIGKKDPNALKVGDTVYGDIRTTDYPSDGFKAAQKFGGGVETAKLEQKLDAVHGDLKLLMSWYRSDKNDKAAGVTSEEPAPKQPAFVPDNVIEDIGDEPINLDNIPF